MADINQFLVHPALGDFESTFNHLENIDDNLLTFEAFIMNEKDIILPNGDEISVSNLNEVRVAIDFSEEPDNTKFVQITDWLSSTSDLLEKKIKLDNALVKNSTAITTTFSTFDLNGNSVIEFLDNA